MTDVTIRFDTEEQALRFMLWMHINGLGNYIEYLIAYNKHIPCTETIENMTFDRNILMIETIGNLC